MDKGCRESSCHLCALLLRLGFIVEQVICVNLNLWCLVLCMTGQQVQGRMIVITCFCTSLRWVVFYVCIPFIAISIQPCYVCIPFIAISIQPCSSGLTCHSSCLHCVTAPSPTASPLATLLPMIHGKRLAWVLWLGFATTSGPQVCGAKECWCAVGAWPLRYAGSNTIL
eukprot:jgi/Botrbrau1/22331/Bobra.0002s0010.1